MNTVAPALTGQDTVPVHEWLSASGTVLGLGTALELEYWKALGVQSSDDQLGKIICHEPASEDERRKAVWAVQS